MKYSLLVFLLLKSFFATASDKTDMDWRKAALDNKLPYNDQAYCYTDATGKLQGVNADLRVRLASVSKLVTSLWSVDVLGLNYKYKTRLFIKDHDLHIEGSLDPFMGNEKMFFLLSQLNDLGHLHFDKITFDKNFIFFPNAQGHIEEHPSITPETIVKNLQSYFNTAQWTPTMKADYARVRSLASPGRMRKEVSFDVNSVEFVSANPHDNETDIQKLTLSSPPLYRYLKEMNVESNNFVAQMFYLQLGGEQKFSEYMKDNFQLESKIVHFYSGSGLPVVIEKKRYDNYATCESIVTFIRALEEKTEKQGQKLEDLVAVPGSDQGTFKNRVFPADYKNAFMAKTGTLLHTSTLAGVMSTQRGLSYWGIFNQGPNIEGAKRVQNEMVASLMTDLGGPKVFDYKVEPFDTYGDDNVKSLFQIKSEFFPVEENLY